jgi:hypothetical protein
MELDQSALTAGWDGGMKPLRPDRRAAKLSTLLLLTSQPQRINSGKGCGAIPRVAVMAPFEFVAASLPGHMEALSCLYVKLQHYPRRGNVAGRLL